MKRRNHTPEFRGVDFRGVDISVLPKKRRTLKLSTVLKVVVIVLLLLAALEVTAPSRLLPECRGDDVPRYCVD